MNPRTAAMLAAGAGATAVGVFAYRQQAKFAVSAGQSKNLYPAYANYPDLTKHNNHMAKVLTPAVSIIFFIK